LDPDSVPATTDFGVKLDSNAAVTPNAVAIEDKTVLLTVDLAKAPGDQGGDVTYTEADVSYTKGTNPIRDPAGNEAAAFTGLERTGLAAKVDVEAAGTPEAVAGTVTSGEAMLVSNTGQTRWGQDRFTYDIAQPFTTGSAISYKLTKLVVPYVTSGSAPPATSHTIKIHASNSSNRPGTSLGTLTYGTVSRAIVGNQTVDTVTYTASGEGIALEAGTTYFAVLDTNGGAVAGNPQWQRTNSNNEDAGKADGWSIGNNKLWKNTLSTSWSTDSLPWQIAIHGTAVTPVTVTVPSDLQTTLVGNTGQSNDGTQDFTLHVRQQFTTGSNAGGYRLTSVTVPYTGSAPAASSHDILIFSSVNKGNLGTSLGTLSYGSVSGTTVTYDAPEGGIDLDPGTHYFVFFDPQSNPSGSQLRTTNSHNEDSGAADGWGIHNNRGTWAGPGKPWNFPVAPWQIAIQGSTLVQKPVTALEVDGASLTVIYDKSLDPTSLPDPDRFTLLEPELEDDGNGNKVAVEYGRVVAVAVSGKQLVLTLNGAAAPCDTFTLSYSRSETERNVQTFSGHEAPDLEAEPVTNLQAGRCDTPQVVVQNGGPSGNSGGTPGKQGKSLTVKFDRPLDTGKALKATAFGLAAASGGAPPAVEGAAYTESGAGVALTLARALESGETVTLGYTRQRGDPGLWNAEGNQIADFSGVAVPVGTSGSPAVTGVEVVSDSGSDGTYALGETIRVRVTFSEAVEVDTAGGTPRLRIDMDPAAHWGMKWMAWESGSGTAELVFAYEVVQPNESTQGIAVLADTLEANGGAIRSASTGADAQLGHDGLDHDPAHKVDWRLTPAPAGTASVTGVEGVSDSGNDDTYALGETIRVRGTFREAVEVDTAGGAPRLDIDMDPAHWGTKRAAYESGSGTASLTFAH
ncbi:MAG: SwmB domain-containing protein, partial [Deltaproteobacteria bacterium]|nr:SwmB domain-containing protein [Deltaproteobacteria bacterium]